MMDNKAQRLFSPGQARRFYDGLGKRLDTQAFYEEPALIDLAAHLNLKTCRAVFEFGCGTGRFAAQILQSGLPPDATYLGVDISSTMVALAKERLARFGQRARVVQSDGTPKINCESGTFDAFMCSYVLDLLPNEIISVLLGEAHRVLAPGGTLGLVSLTRGPRLLSSLVTSTLQGLHRVSPWLVGGCRPVELRSFLPDDAWTIYHRNVLTSFGIPSEIIAATKRPAG
jgi:SAM-dependent methyltransferase